MANPRKPGNRRDNHQAARALADWARHGFTRASEEQIADTYKVATRTLWRWKDALETDTELSALFRDGINEHLTRDWADELDEALRETITRLRALISTCESLTEVTEAFKALSEIAITREVLNVTRHAEPYSIHGQASAEAQAGGSAQRLN